MTDEEYLVELHQAVAARSSAASDFTESSFSALVADALTDSGTVGGFEPAQFLHRGMRIDGYFMVDEESTLELFVVEWFGEPTVTSLTRSVLESCIKRAETFFDRACDKDLAHDVDVGSAIWGFARLLGQNSSAISRVRLNVLSDGRLSSAVKELPARDRDGREWVYRVWDLTAIGRMLFTGEPDEISIDFVELFGEGLPCLAAHTGNKEIDSYLAVIPGNWLAKIYEMYSGRLLEQNVRTFLQVKGGVNKGIRRTILDEPDMFFAYNNGISATASSAELEVDGASGLRRIRRLKHLQIVNGAQTTASIYNVMKKDKEKAGNIDDIRVQMKLSVVRPEKVPEIVPKISEYANSQNKVNAADFFSNHPFHVRVESFSRRIWTPTAEGTQLQTHWYYERVRGQYVNSVAYLTAARKKEFEATNPRKQVIEKTELARVFMTWGCRPHIVSFGSQKNFAKFAELIAEKWKDDGVEFSEDWYKDSVSQIIVFKALERDVQEAEWYAKGFRAQIVTYTIALLQHTLDTKRHSVDFKRIWARQSPGPGLASFLLALAEKVNSRLVKGAIEYQMVNVTEWCKRERCWDDIKANVHLVMDDSLAADLVTGQERAAEQRDGRRVQRQLNGIEAQTAVISKPAGYWGRMKIWAEGGIAMTPGDIRTISVAAAMRAGRLPNPVQCEQLLEIEHRAKKEGFR